MDLNESGALVRQAVGSKPLSWIDIKKNSSIIRIRTICGGKNIIGVSDAICVWFWTLVVSRWIGGI